MNPIDQLTNQFIKLPGVGPKQARRFAYFFLYTHPSVSTGLISALTDIRNNIATCPHCFSFFQLHNNQQDTLCEICSKPSTDITSMLIISSDLDIETIKKTGVYNGRYFILGGTVPILKNHKSIDRVRSKELFNEVKRAIREDSLKEIIFAFSINPEGEHTEIYVKKILAPLIEAGNISISHLGRGMSTGTELEYVDDETFKNALSNRV